MVMDMCYQNSAKVYREQMAGNIDAGRLPAPQSSLGATQWENAAKKFGLIREEIDRAMREAAAAHSGSAAESANRAVQEIQPHLQKFQDSSNQVAKAVTSQADIQHQAFQQLPAPGQNLPNGRPAQLEPPQKGWVEDWGLDSNPVTGWMSDYEERQQDFATTNEQADAAMTRYRSQTESAMAGLPQFEAPAPAPGPGGQDSASAYSASSTPSGGGGSSSSGSAAPAGSSSAWSGTIPASTTPAHAPAAPPAGSGSAWAPPPLVTRGPDGSQWRQNPKTGAWERIGANGQPIPGRGAGGSAGGSAGRAGGSAAGRGSASAAEPGAGGRSGVGGTGRGAAATGAANGPAGSGGRGGAGAPMGGGGAGRGGQDEDEQEHSRPGWLVEHEDVFTNDLDRVAPPVFGDWNNEER